MQNSDSQTVACPNCGHQHRCSKSDQLPACVECGISMEDVVRRVLTATIIRSSTTTDATRDGVSKSESAVTRLAPSIGNLGRFELKSVLGAGGFGKVYKAFDPQLERFLALKVPTVSSADAALTDRFLSEAKAAARLKHPNIVTTFETGKAEGRYFIATEFVDGDLLSNLLKHDQIDVKEAATWVSKLARASAYAHKKDVLHRDIKPHNVIIDKRREPQLLDFGLAKRLDDESKATSDGMLLGTPAYMSPEQSRGELSKLTGASDQYSLGVVLFQLVTGTTPHRGLPHFVLAMTASGKTKNIREVVPTADRTLDAICAQAMQPLAVDRYSSCDDLADDLDAWCEGRPVSVRRKSILQRTGEFLVRNRTRLLTSCTLACLCLAAGVIGWELFFKLDKATTEVADEATDPVERVKSSQQVISAQGAEELNEELWKAVVRPIGEQPSEAQLQQFRIVCEQHPRGTYFNTLGVALYRSAEYAEAVRWLNQSLTMTPAERKLVSDHPSDLAFLALSHRELGEVAEANNFCGKFVESMQHLQFYLDPECIDFSREILTAFGDRPELNKLVYRDDDSPSNQPTRNTPLPAPITKMDPADPISISEFNRMGDFEEFRAAEWQHWAWRSTASGAISTTEHKFEGTRSLEIRSTKEPNDVFIERVVRVKPHTRYRLAGSIRTEDVVMSEEEKGTTGASLRLEGIQAGSHFTSRVGTSAWKRVTRDFSSTDDTVKIGCRLGHHGSTCTGTAWFDDLRLEEVTSKRE